MRHSYRVVKRNSTPLEPPQVDPCCCRPKLKVGILAYGSLITDPGPEIGPQIRMRIKLQTPFPVEYGRLSQKRGGAPTLVPHPHGAPVSGEILVLDDSVSIDEACHMLWRRERRRTGSGEQYVEGSSPNRTHVLGSSLRGHRPLH